MKDFSSFYLLVLVAFALGYFFVAKIIVTY